VQWESAVLGKGRLARIPAAADGAETSGTTGVPWVTHAPRVASAGTTGQCRQRDRATPR
jgi:hypothetical protein